MVLQLIALAVGAGGVRLADEFPVPPEQVAIYEMLVVQIVVGSLLFPILLPSIRVSIMLAAAAWPMTYLAGVLSATSLPRTVLAAGYVTAYLGALCLWRMILSTRRAQLSAVAAAAMFSLGGALLWYLRADFVGPAEGSTWQRDSVLGPILGVFSLLHTKPPTVRPWALIALLGAIPAGILLIRHFTRQVIHNSSTEQIPK